MRAGTAGIGLDGAALNADVEPAEAACNSDRETERLRDAVPVVLGLVRAGEAGIGRGPVPCEAEVVEVAEVDDGVRRSCGGPGVSAEPEPEPEPEPDLDKETSMSNLLCDSSRM